MAEGGNGDGGNGRGGRRGDPLPGRRAVLVCLAGAGAIGLFLWLAVRREATGPD